MKVATITEVKNGLSALIDYVRSGETVLIVERGRPVARLEPALSSDDDEFKGRLERLQRQGILRAGSGEPVELIVATDPPTGEESVLAALLEERREGR
ncbi:MAG TPA: type II toxin-antitoxin system prevent-host-death family antitoxin [Actinomycetota bacterium]|nr:type II toxin-antitoxin system prevent-host-death family antitoxin [Actinomycetota bacterium]